jgi:anaerobic selenocysteine-containing dehydrogenase
VRIVSDHDAIEAIVEPDEDVRPGVVSMAHSWGGLPDEGRVEEVGSYTGLLISTDRDLETINAMPRQSAIPVRIERVCNVGSEEAEAARDAPRHVEIST